MNLVMLPEKSNLCGQAVIAMIADISLKESIKIFNSKSTTTTRQLIAVLQELNIRCANKLIRLKKQHELFQHKLPNICIVKLHFTEYSRTHWCVFYYGKYYDSCAGIRNELESYVYQTSYLEILQ